MLMPRARLIRVSRGVSHMISRSSLQAIGLAAALIGLNPADALAQTAGTEAARLELAERLMNLSQGASITKQIERQVRETADETPGLSDEQRAWMTANMPRMASDMLADLLEDLAGIYAENFTTAELQAQIDFYETPLGRSIIEKSVAIGFEQSEVMGVHQEDFVTELMTKFCLRFDCTAPAGGSKAD